MDNTKEVGVYIPFYQNLNLCENFQIILDLRGHLGKIIALTSSMVVITKKQISWPLEHFILYYTIISLDSTFWTWKLDIPEENI